jgi:hypothetical protein
MTNNEIHEMTLGVMRSLGLKPDPWQIDVITGEHQRLLLNCSRQSGKTTVVAILGLVEALARPMTRILLVSRSLRQSREMFRLMTHYHQVLKSPSLKRQTAEELEFMNLSRIVCVPCSEETIRGFAKVDLLVIDEAARVPDDLYRAVRPMLAVSRGRLIALSTPYGKRGWFHDAWARGGDDWARIQVAADLCPRITPEFLDQERRALGESWYRQEYFCSFETVEGVVYPDFARCVVGKVASGQWLVASEPCAPPSETSHQPLATSHSFDATSHLIGGGHHTNRSGTQGTPGHHERFLALCLQERKRPLRSSRDRPQGQGSGTAGGRVLY